MNSSNRSDGFALPTILIASIIMLSVLLVSVASTVAIRVSLSAQYYDQMAKTAGDAGLAYAKACLDANSGIPSWTDANPLTPSTDCSGTQLSGFTCSTGAINPRCFVTINDNVVSTFSVGKPAVNSGNKATEVNSVGSTKLLTSSSRTVWRTYSQSSRLTIPL